MKIQSFGHNGRYNLIAKKYNRATKKTTETQHDCKALSLLANYKKCYINFGSGIKLDKEQIEKLKIPNLHIIENNCVRGESLSSKKNRKFLKPIKNFGIEDIIDLRDKYTSGSYADLCSQYKLQYHHIPIDSDSVEDEDIIKNLKELFAVLDKGKAYIACAQGLHRTDIALAINYIFNPVKQQQPPIMYGHFRNYGFKTEDISRRINSLVKKITQSDLSDIGWQSDVFEEEVQKRKKELYDFNRKLQ